MRPQPPAGATAGPDESIDRLVADWWILQLRGGHRFSTDDLLTAWRASLARPDARTCLDLGCGIGSVGLYLLGLFHLAGRDDVRLTGVEAQAVSLGLARRTVALNGLEDRVTLHHGDLRDPSVLPGDATFDLVTGSPPYIPLGKGLVSPHPQRAACRMELRGSVIDYARAARPRIAPGGRFTYVMAARDPRAEEAAVAADLVVRERLDVVFREGEAPMIAVITAARSEDGPHPDRRDETLLVRRADRSYAPAYAALRAQLGFPVR